MPATIQQFVSGTNVLTPVQFPEQARETAGAFGPSQTLNAGAVIAKKTADGLLYAYNSGGADGTQNAAGLNKYTLATDANNNVFYGGSTNASSLNVPLPTSVYYISGTFDPADLTGWGTNSASSLNARTLNASGFIRIP